MPKFIGNDIANTQEIGKNATKVNGYVRITYVQACRLPASAVLKSLDTTDKGGRRSLAKRWYRWFGSVEAILRSPNATPNMLTRAKS